ncbi:MAG: DNA-directed RNA polymerase subunit P [Candidatus Aenigmarchaeota archaeon]|nr:DNA-directed RNA polymerase subunit P [Candidatus Aenigmarchaeota archaeon]
MSYQCLNCGKQVDLDLKAAKKIQCSYCGYRILEKLRPPVAKRLSAV